MSKELKLNKWNEKKKQIEQTKKQKFCQIGKIYYVNLGQNIGSEIYGKGGEFLRPVLVINKFFIHHRLDLALVIPLSSKTAKKSGYFYHHFKDNKNKEQVALLCQIKVIDTKRIVNYHSKIDNEELQKIKEKIKSKII